MGRLTDAYREDYGIHSKEYWDGYYDAQEDALTFLTAILEVTGPIEVPDSAIVSADKARFVLEACGFHQKTRISLRD